MGPCSLKKGSTAGYDPDGNAHLKSEEGRFDMQRSMIFWVFLSLALAMDGGCRRDKSSQSAMQVDLTFDPSPPVVGKVDVTLTLKDEKGKLLANAEVQIEGNMNHAGMKPSFATLTETQPGRYTGPLDFTMGGDWFIIVTAKIPGGRQWEQKIDVPGVGAG